MKAFRLGYIKENEAPCADNTEISLLRQWKVLASDMGVLRNLGKNSL
jgi:hypothetical protein